MMNNLLFVSIYPFPVDMGSKQHAYFMLKALATRFNVYCLFFLPPNRKRSINAEKKLSDIGIVDYKLCSFIENKNGSVQSKIQDLISFPNHFMQSATHRQGAHMIGSILNKRSFDVVLYEHFWLTKYAFIFSSKVKQAVVYHDLHHKIFGQMAAFEIKINRKLRLLFDSLKFKIYEHLLDNHVALKIFLNPIEMQDLPKNSVHIPHIVNANIYYRHPRDTDFFNILFIGTFSHPPNRLSFDYILKDIVPLLAPIQPNCKIHVVGPGTEQLRHEIVRSPFRNHFCVHGFKSDINDAFEKMDIALLPILSGGGIKTKIIDTLAAGVPVVTTDKGIEGLSSFAKDCISVANAPEGIVEKTLALMRSYPLRVEKSREGKKFIEEMHSFPAFSNKVTQTLLSINATVSS